jgi:hypothetical protein
MLSTFNTWYNGEHRYSGIMLLTPSDLDLPPPKASTRRQGLRCALIALRATTPWQRALGLRLTVNGETTADGAANPANHA